MNTPKPSPTRRSTRPSRSFLPLFLAVAIHAIRPPLAGAAPAVKESVVKVNLSEWKVQITPKTIPPGPVAFEVANSGSIPHAFEVEGRGIEKRSPQIGAGATTTLKADLRAGNYEIYCPVGKGSHKMLGMSSHLAVLAARSSAENAPGGEPRAKSAPAPAGERGDGHGAHEHAGMDAGEKDESDHAAKRIKVTGGGTVIQILPGAFPFADSAQAVIRNRPPDQQADLTKKSHLGPYSNNVAPITGTFTLEATDGGASGDSVAGTAQFTAQDGSRWKVVMDRVQTRDIPFNPRFGGVIMGLFYHGASGVHTPLVPTIQSSLALWAYAHLYRNEQLVTDDAMVHVMLLSRTRRPSDWALDCWDCSERPVEELQLQVTPGPNTPPFEAPGGFLFVNWEKSSGQRLSM